MLCKKCSTPNEKDNVFCKKCGQRLKSKGRGFASMDKNRQRAIASAAGKKAHADGKAHKFTSDEARKAGAIGGSRKKKTTHDSL